MFSTIPKLRPLTSRSVFARQWEVREDFEYQIDSLKLRFLFVSEILYLDAWNDFSNFEVFPEESILLFKGIRVLQGTISDLASIPRFLWWFMAPTDFIRASILHDELYEYIRLLKAQGKNVKILRYIIDRIFLESLKYTKPEIEKDGSLLKKLRTRVIRGYLTLKHYIAYSVVRLFGWTTLRPRR